MSSPPPENPSELSGAEESQVQGWLAEADAAAKAEDWDRTVALYRKAQEFDRYLQGVEAKLQWAIRMRDTEKLYRDGKAKFEAGQYEAALVPLRKARLLYASHYKDVDDLIVKSQSALQKERWEKRPHERGAEPKGKKVAATQTMSSTQTKATNDVPQLLAGLVGVAAFIALAVYLSVSSGKSVSPAPTVAIPTAGATTSSGTPAAGALPTVVGTATTTASGLQIIDVQVGSGPEAKAGQTVTVNYTGYLTNGTVFDSTAKHGQPFQFQLGAGRVIKGWDEGVAGMKVGGKRRLIIPSSLGYGPQGAPPDIPPNAELVFDIELVSVQ